MGMLSHRYKHIVTALLLSVGACAPSWAQETGIDALYQELLDADETSHARIADRITSQWEKSGSAAMDLLYRRGEDALEAGNTAEAIEHFTALVDHAPDFAEGYHGRASAYYALGLIGPAIDDLRQVLALNPRQYDAMLGVGVLMEEIDRADDAREVYQMILDIYPLNPQALDAMARLESQFEGQSL